MAFELFPLALDDVPVHLRLPPEGQPCPCASSPISWPFTGWRPRRRAGSPGTQSAQEAGNTTLLRRAHNPETPAPWIGSLGRPPRYARPAPQPWPRARSHKGGVLAGRLSIPLGRHLLGPKPPSAGLFLRRSLSMPPSPPRDPPSATTEDQHQHHDDRDDQHHQPDAHLTSPLPDFIGDAGPRAGPGISHLPSLRQAGNATPRTH